MFPLRCVIISALAVLSVSSCAHAQSRIAANQPSPTTPRYIDLLAERQVATLHFPAGRYFLYGVNAKGFYYRAPRPVVQHTGGGSVLRNGGLFLNRTNENKIRGYIYLAGALTHVGDFSRARYVFGH